MPLTSGLSLSRLPGAPQPWANLELLGAVLLSLVYAGLATWLVLQWAGATAALDAAAPAAFGPLGVELW
jgi:hypothetical protein